MAKSRESFGAAPWLILASAVLHAVAGLGVGLSAGGASLVGVGVLYVCAALGLRRGFRWLAHLAFLVLLGGTIAALGNAYGPSAASHWAFLGIATVNSLAVGVLFARLWHAPSADAAR